MDITSQIKTYLMGLPEAKGADLETLHKHMLQAYPSTKLWFLDGRDEKGKVVSNPNIGYGTQTMRYADGKAKEFYQIGISGNTTGISVYIMGMADKTHLPETYGPRIGKATVTGYCIKFKALKDIHMDVLEAAIHEGMKKTSH